MSSDPTKSSGGEGAGPSGSEPAAPPTGPSSQGSTFTFAAPFAVPGSVAQGSKLPFTCTSFVAFLENI